MKRDEAEQYILSNYGGVEQDWPWEDTPEYSVFRHVDNRKWFALFMRVNGKTLHLEQADEIDIVNLKSDPDLIEELVKEPGILPAYHMNKRHWVTLLLDGTIPHERLASLIALSYRLTA